VSRKDVARVLGGALVAAAAGGLAWGMLRTRESSSSGPASGAAAEWTCACGQVFRMSGAGRHRVYWRAGAPPDEPVVGDRCPSCDRPLPADRELAAG
jgi:hypothetical protein